MYFNSEMIPCFFYLIITKAFFHAISVKISLELLFSFLWVLGGMSYEMHLLVMVQPHVGTFLLSTTPCVLLL